MKTEWIYRIRKNENGFVLVLALVTMVAMTLIGLSLMMNITTDLQLSRNERDAKAAFQLAEAGVNEAIARLHMSTTNSRYIGEKSADTGYRTTTWNNNNSLGRDFSSISAIAGDLGTGNSYSVTLRYLAEGNTEGFCDSNDVDPNTTGNAAVPPGSCVNDSEIVMFGQDFNINSTATKITIGKLPVYQVTSTGTSNDITRTVVAYIGASMLNTDTEYGLNTNACIDVAGGSNNLGEVKQGPGCGCDAQITGSCAANKASTDNMQTYLGEDLSTVISMANEKHYCKGATCNAAGDDIPSSGSIDTVVLDWGDFAGNTRSSMIYIDNSGGKEVSISGNFSGRGILIVTGDLKLSGSLQYEGLIYVFGTLTISGGGSNLNVLGGVMANNTVSINGGVTVTYDQPTLLDVAKESSSSAILIWKRL